MKEDSRNWWVDKVNKRQTKTVMDFVCRVPPRGQVLKLRILRAERFSWQPFLSQSSAFFWCQWTDTALWGIVTLRKNVASTKRMITYYHTSCMSVRRIFQCDLAWAKFEKWGVFEDGMEIINETILEIKENYVI